MAETVLSPQETTQTIQARYERARHLLRGAYSDQVVFNDVVYPTWIDDTDSFWYIRVVKEETGVSHEVRIVDVNEKINKLAFDNNSLATALEKVTGKKLKGKALKFLQGCPGMNMSLIEISLNPDILEFTFSGTRWSYEIVSGNLQKAKEQTPAFDTVSYLSPDGTKLAFTKENNVWIRDIESGKERPLTSDGTVSNGYSIGMGTYAGEDRNNFYGRWSSDGKYFLTTWHDTRQVKEILTTQYKVGGDDFRIATGKYPPLSLPGDDEVGTYHYVAIDVKTGKRTTAEYPKLSNEYITVFRVFKLAWWGKDSRLAYFIDADRYNKNVRLVEFEIATGATRVLFEEQSESSVKFSHMWEDKPVMMPLPQTEELLWYSERSGFGHLYLYDLKSGKLKNEITGGDWVVRAIVEYDATRREVFVQTSGRDKKKDPYYRDLVRVNIDTGEMVALADSKHDIDAYSQQSVVTSDWGGFKTQGVSRTGNYAVVTKSRVDTVPVSYLVDRDGRKVMEIEKADISRLPEDFHWPEPVKTLAADGKTYIYGVIYRPSDFSSDKSYPVVSHVMNSSLTHFTAKSAFNGHGWSSMLPAMALAELGFIVLQFDGRGTPARGKAFQDHSYGWNNGPTTSDLSDHVEGIRQLAKRYPYMDLDRVGIMTEMVGPSAVWGLLKYPDFYKVGVEGAVIDDRANGAWVSDMFNGPDDAGHQRQYPEQLVDKLKGKLLLPLSSGTYGDPFLSQIRLAGAFAAANKDIDISFDAGNAWYTTTYQIRQGWDYLVRHLQHNTPPENFKLDGTALWDTGVLSAANEEIFEAMGMEKAEDTHAE